MRKLDFAPLYRSTVGFDHLSSLLETVNRSDSGTQTYPPYNIEQISESILRITIAVAGFQKSELNINLEGNQLIIRGSKNDNDNEKIFIHRGIATRQFQRRFIIAEGIEVNGASIENGLLNIDLVQPLSKEKSLEIEIKDKPKKDNEKNLINLNLKEKKNEGSI